MGRAHENLISAENNYAHSISHKDSIKIENYAYTVMVPREKKIPYFWGWGPFKKTVWDTKTVWEPEIRHNHDHYNHDLHLALQSCDKSKEALIAAQKSAQTEVAMELSAAERECDNARATYNNVNSAVSSKNTEITNLHRKIQSDRQTKFTQENIARELSERNVHATATLNSTIERQKAENDASLTMIENATKQQRSMLLIKMFNNPAFQNKIIKHIDKLGCDLGCLAGFALDNNREDLLDYAINHGLDADQERDGEEVTNIVLKAIRSGSPFLNKILDATKDFSCTITFAIDELDIETLDCLLEHNPGLSYLKQGNLESMSILHAAIAMNSVEVVRYLTEHHNESIRELINVPSSHGERIMEIALRNGNQECIEIIAGHTNLETELVHLISKGDNEEITDLITKLVELYPECATTLARCHALIEGNEGATRALINEQNYKTVLDTLLEQENLNTDLSYILSLTINQDDTETLGKILEHNINLTYFKQANSESINLLQAAISLNSLKIVEYLLNHQSESIKELANIPNSNGERALQIALKTGSADCVNLIAQHTNLETELTYLVEQENNEETLEHITRLVELYPDSATDSVAYHALLKENEGAARVLLNSENYIGALSIAISDRAYEVKDKLIEIKNELFPEIDQADAAQDYHDIDQLMGADLLDLDYQDFALGENSYEIMHYQQ